MDVGRRVFDSRVRRDAGPRRHSESWFRFLDRAAGAPWDRIRRLLDEWLSTHPIEAREDVRRRLRLDDDGAFMGASWELYLARSLIRMGYQVQAHPDLQGTARRPDFLVSNSSGACFFEATYSGPSGEELKAERRKGRIYDLINDLPSPDVFLAMSIDEEGSGDPPTQRLRADLERWMAALNIDELRQLDPEEVRARHTKVFDTQGWHLRFWPIPKAFGDPDPEDPTIGFYPVRSGVIDASGQLRRAVTDKARRYGELERPYVVAVLVTNRVMTDRHVFDALFGSIAIQQAPMKAGGSGDVRFVRQADGVWATTSGPVNTRISAVLTAMRVMSGTGLPSGAGSRGR